MKGYYPALLVQSCPRGAANQHTQAGGESKGYQKKKKKLCHSEFVMVIQNLMIRDC